MGGKRLAAVFGLAAVLTSTVGFAAHAEWDPNPVNGFSTATNYQGCGSGDRPEADIQGDVGDTSNNGAFGGFNCNISFVGHAVLDGSDPRNQDKGKRNYHRNATGNANMAWAGNCAYVSGPTDAIAPDAPASPPTGGGVAVVDVSNPRDPVHVRTLHDPGGAATSETIAAITTDTHPARSILVVGQYGNTSLDSSPVTTTEDPLGTTKPMDIYDVTSDCTTPRLMAHYDWPLNIHNLTITKDGKYVIATQPLQVLDISGLWDTPKSDPKWLGNLDKAMEGPMFAVGPSADLDDNVPGANSKTNPSYTSHEAYALQEGGRTKLYLGGQLPTFELMTIVDITDWLQRRPDGTPVGPPDIISQESGRGHSVRMATINDTRYLLHSEESPFGSGFSCSPETANPFAGAAQPWLTNIGDETKPVLTSQMGLAINLPENCPTQLQRNETDSVHYHDVDDPNDTTLVFASMWNAGIRVFDVRDPVHPTEVGYFNTGDLDSSENGTNLDHVWGHVRYVADKGQIWFASADGGFWVVELESKLRDIPHTPPIAPAINADGLPGVTTAASLNVPLSASIDVAPYYCTLGTFEGLNSPTP
jgi:hypothetical protein